MALVYDGTDGLFTRLGKLIAMMDAVRAHQANLKTLFATVQGTYSSSDRYMIDQLSGNLEARIEEAGLVLQDVRAAAEKTLIEMTFDEASSSTTNAMREKTVQDALIWLIRQMDADAESIDGNTISKSGLSVGGSNNGNGTFLYLFEAPNILLGSTNDWPNIRTELVEARCVQDAQDGSIARGTEIFEIRGQPSYPPLDYRFPAGSGTFMRLSSVTASTDAGARGANIATNSDFEDQTSNVPDNWTVSSGTAGTDFLTETTNVYRGSKSFEFLATGNVVKIRQQLGSGTGSLGRLTPDRPYMISFALKKDAGSTGTIRVSVQDASGNVIDSGNFKREQSIASATTSFALYSATLRSPRIIPSETYLVVESTVAVATAACYIDEVIVAEMMSIAPGGQAIGIIAGSSDWYVDDNARYSFTNDGDAYTSAKFARAFDRLFDMYRRGLSIPANYFGSETILDSLI
jgi:hypothetical protein